MKQACRSDKQKVIRVICESFDKNPHINFLVRNDAKRCKRMEALAAYAFEIGYRRGGVYFTDDETGIAIIIDSRPYDHPCLIQ